MSIQPFEQKTPQSSPEHGSEAFLEFAKKIEGVIEHEKAHPGDGSHLSIYPNFKVDELIPADMDIWNKLEGDQLTLEEYRAWREAIDEEAPLVSNSEEMKNLPSRELFADLVGNMLTRSLVEKQLKWTA